MSTRVPHLRSIIIVNVKAVLLRLLPLQVSSLRECVTLCQVLVQQPQVVALSILI